LHLAREHVGVRMRERERWNSRGVDRIVERARVCDPIGRRAHGADDERDSAELRSGARPEDARSDCIRVIPAIACALHAIVDE
jgi:hypothetical protein